MSRGSNQTKVSIGAIKLSPDHKLLACGYQYKQDGQGATYVKGVMLFNAETGACIAKLDARVLANDESANEDVKHIGFSTDSKCMAFAARTSAVADFVYVWDIDDRDSGPLVLHHKRHKVAGEIVYPRVTGIAFSPVDSNTLVVSGDVGGARGIIVAWDLKRTRASTPAGGQSGHRKFRPECGRVFRFNLSVSAMAITSDGQIVLAATQGGRIVSWRLMGRAVVGKVIHKTKPIAWISASSNPQEAFAGMCSGEIAVFGTDSHSRLDFLCTPPAPGEYLTTISPSRRLVMQFAAENKTLVLRCLQERPGERRVLASFRNLDLLGIAPVFSSLEREFFYAVVRDPESGEPCIQKINMAGIPVNQMDCYGIGAFACILCRTSFMVFDKGDTLCIHCEGPVQACVTALIDRRQHTGKWFDSDGISRPFACQTQAKPDGIVGTRDFRLSVSRLSLYSDKSFRVHRQQTTH